MSFRAICDRHLGQQASQIPTYNDIALLQSLGARAEEHAIRASEWGAKTAIALARAGNYRSYALIVGGIVVAILAMLLQPRVDSQKPIVHLTEFSDFAAENLLVIALLVLLATLFVWVLTVTSTRPKHVLVRDTFELANVYRWRSASLSAVAALVILIVAAVIAWPAVSHFYTTIKSAILVFI